MDTVDGQPMPDYVEDVRRRMRAVLRAPAATCVSIVDVIVPPWRIRAERNARIMRDDTPIYHRLCITHGVYPHDGAP